MPMTTQIAAALAPTARVARPAVDDPGQHVASQEVAPERYRRRRARRRERAPDDGEGVDGIEGGHDEDEAEHRRDQGEARDGGALADEGGPDLPPGASCRRRGPQRAARGHGGPPAAAAPSPILGSTMR